jgi:hypothetical protein
MRGTSYVHPTPDFVNRSKLPTWVATSSPTEKWWTHRADRNTVATHIRCRYTQLMDQQTKS